MAQNLLSKICAELLVFIKKIITYQIAQTMATLLTSGVELKHSLEIVKYVMGNRVYEEKFDQIAGDITKKGLDLSQALRQSAIFPGRLLINNPPVFI